MAESQIDMNEKKVANLTVDEPDVQEGVIKELDQAEVFLRENNISHDELQELLGDEQSVKKLVRKVDFMLMPLLCGTYLLQYIDKQSISYAAVFDLFDSTNTNSNQYSWLISLFYFGYLLAEWPASYLAQRYPTGTVVSVSIILWGSILMITAACSDFKGLAVCRFLLGCFESFITPVFMMIVGQWYQRKEQSARAGAFYCFNGVGASVGGILFFAIGQARGFAIWRAIFLLAGGCTVLWGFVLLFLLPNNIMTAKRFSTREKATLIARSQQNQTGVFNPKINLAQVREALIDPQVWLLFLFVLLNETVNGGIASFSKLIIKGLANGNALVTTAYGIPVGCWQVFFVFTGPWLAGRLRNARTYIMALYICPTVIGTALLWQIPHTQEHAKGLLVTCYLLGSYVASLVIALQLPANNVGGYTKRVTATAFVFLAYCIGNIIGPHAFLESEAPIYGTGCTVAMACASGQIVLSFVLRALLVRRNKKRDEAYGLPQPATGEIEDLTDFENKNFRYSY